MQLGSENRKHLRGSISSHNTPLCHHKLTAALWALVGTIA